MELEHHVDETLTPEQANRRLPNAFILFCKKHRSIVKEKYPNLENRNITKILGEWWTSLGPDEKNVFNNLAAELKEHHQAKESQAAAQRKVAPMLAPRDQVLDTTNSLSAAVILAAASPAAPYWKKQGQNGSNGGWQPQQQVVHWQSSKSGSNPGSTSQPASRESSGSCSPEPKPSSESSNDVVAPNPKKTFKQRYLADEKAKLVSLSAAEPETNACEALLQLAGGGIHHGIQQSAVSGNTTRSNSGTCSPKESGDGSGTMIKRSGAGFQSLRDAVWTKVAQTILMQEKEKGTSTEQADQPMNLSNQCTIRSQSIIEHIIENMLDEPVPQAQGLNNNSDGSETAEQIKERIYQSLKDDIMNRAANNIQDEFKGRNALWNVLPNPKLSGSNPPPEGSVLLPVNPVNNGHKKPPSPAGTAVAATPTAVTVATVTPVAAPMAAMLVQLPTKKEEPVHITPSVSVTLVPMYPKEPNPGENPLNLSTTPPQTPGSSSHSGGVAITITTSPAKRILLDDDDDDIRRSARSCKGRRYQEFKEAVGRKGRRSHRSGDSSDLMSEEETSLTPLNLLSSESASQRPRSHSESNGAAAFPGKQDAEKEKSKFDVDKELNAIPALDLDLFQQKILNNRMAAKAAAASGAPPVVHKRGPQGEVGPQQSAKKKARKSEPMRPRPQMMGGGGHGVLN